MKNIIDNSEQSLKFNPNWIISYYTKMGNITSTDTLKGIIFYFLKDEKLQF